MTVALVPAEQEKVEEVASRVSSVVETAQAIEVQTPEQAAHAADFLKEIASAKRQSETSRKIIVDPLNAHVKTINGLFKPKVEALDEADKLVRGKVIAFQQEQRKAQEAEQARLDAIRREEEEKVEAERRRLAQGAADAEREAAEAEARRQAEIAESEGARCQEIVALTDEDLLELIEAPVGSVSSKDAEIGRVELRRRRATREAQERAAKARQEAEEAQQREIAAKSAPALAVATPTALAGVSGRTEWKATEILDKSKVPDEYLIVDMKKINAVVKAGVREIPGVKIEQVAGLAVRAK